MLEMRVARYEYALTIAAVGLPAAPFLRLRSAEDSLKFMDFRLVELETIAVGSSGQQLGVRPDTPCLLVEDSKERRRSWKEALGARPERHFVCHRCDQPTCAAADHLFWGTATDNARDCTIKGRHGRHKRDYGSPEAYVAARRERIVARRSVIERRIERLKESIVLMFK